MRIYSKYVVTLLICILWSFVVFALRSLPYHPSFDWQVLTALFLACVSTFVLMSLYKLETKEEARQRKMERFMRDLKPDDLAILRERLSFENGADGEYESIEVLLSEQKQKRG
jgi:hypothetical protein